MSGARLTGLVTAAVSFTVSSLARADGIDAVWYFSRVPGWHRAPLRAAVLLVALMATNYLLNFVVIGAPALRMGARSSSVARDLLSFTLLGQAADRFGALAGPLLGGILLTIARVSPKNQLGLMFAIGVPLGFVLAGIIVGLASRWYMRRRWLLAGRRVIVIVWAAAVLTNPMWGVLAMQFVPNPDYRPRTVLHS